MASRLRIAAVQPIADAYSLSVEWSNGKRHTIDLKEFIASFPGLALLNRLEIFERVSVGEWGFDVQWEGGLEIAASTLYRLALEQAGQVMPTRDFKQWMAKNKLSLSAAAIELGFTRRTITAYSSGAALIPKHVALACRGWECENGLGMTRQ